MRERTSRDLDIYLSPLDRPLSYDHEFDDMQTSLPSKLPPTVDIFDGQIIPIGHLKLTVVHTPGHTPGHVSLHCKEHGFLAWFYTSAKENINIAESLQLLAENLLDNKNIDAETTIYEGINVVDATVVSRCCNL